MAAGWLQPLAAAAAVFLSISSASSSSSFAAAAGDTFFLDCGSDSPTTLAGDSPPRTFSPDSAFLIAASDSDTFPLQNPDPPATSLKLYTTARVFAAAATYRFPISAAGTHVLRLHFLPFSSAGHNLSSSAIFNVSAIAFLLLAAFSPPPASITIKEYFLWVDPGVLDVVFSPTNIAFVNAVEVFAAPANLIDDDRFSRQALQTVHRVNVGGALVTPANDTLWRTWVPDDEFIVDATLSVKNSTTERVRYGAGDPRRTPDVAPESVYDTARTMNVPASLRQGNPSFDFNVTWSFLVDPGHLYFVRLHFCDFVSPDATQLFFDVYLGDELSPAYQDLQPGSLTGDTPAAAFFWNFAVDGSGGGGRLNVSIGRSRMSTPLTANAILNGVEIMKMNNSAGSLDGTFNPNQQQSPAGKKRRSFVIPVVAGSGAVAVVAAAAASLLFLRKLRRRGSSSSTTDQKAEAFVDVAAVVGAGAPSSGAGESKRRIGNRLAGMYIPLADIRMATNDFSQALVIGAGGFGKVYKGAMKDGTDIAVKRAVPGSMQGYPEFENEVKLLSGIRHRHLVSLVGYCDDPPEMILVYEYMEQGTLRSYLYGSGARRSSCLTWKQRLEICIGAGRGLHYLHTGLSKVVIHRDVKSTNILLGEGLLAKVADFGLSKLAGELESGGGVSTGVKGSFGYLDPEYFRLQRLTVKSDVYSFGVLMFEVLCARPVVADLRRSSSSSPEEEMMNLAEWAVRCRREGRLEMVVDQRLMAAGGVDRKSLRKFGETAERCVAEYGDDRPSIADVLWSLEYALQLHETRMVGREPHEDSGSFVGAGWPAPPPLPLSPSAAEEEEEGGG